MATIYVAGDASGIEEASTAILEGRIAGLAIAHSLGCLDEAAFSSQREGLLSGMAGLRDGPHGVARREAKEFINAAVQG